MKILVTGGAGFIGTAVLKTAIANEPQHEYCSLDLAPCSVDGVTSVVGSILDSNQVTSAVRDCDIVIHLAAVLGVNRTDTHPLECLKINLEGTVTLLEACAMERIRKFVFASSSEVYGSRAEPRSETDSLGPVSVYGAGKLAAEHYVIAYASTFQFEWSIARFFNVYGLCQLSDWVVPRFVENASKGQSPVVYGDGSRVRSFCNVRDTAQGVVLMALKREANRQILNLGNDQCTVTIRELAEQVCSLSGNNLESKFVPYSNADRVAGRDPLCRRPDITKARTLLGYEPKVSLDEGLTELLQAFQAISAEEGK